MRYFCFASDFNYDSRMHELSLIHNYCEQNPDSEIEVGIEATLLEGIKTELRNSVNGYAIVHKVLVIFS